MSTAARFTTAADVLVSWRDGVLTAKAPTLYRLGTGELSRIEVGPGLVALFGGAPGAECFPSHYDVSTEAVSTGMTKYSGAASVPARDRYYSTLQRAVDWVIVTQPSHQRVSMRRQQSLPDITWNQHKPG